MPNDHSLLVWVLDQTLGLLQRSAKTAEQEEAVKELRTLALLPKPDKAKLESLVHRLESVVSSKPELARTHRTLQRADIMEVRPVRITLDRELNRLIESIGKKSAARRTPAKKAAGKKAAVTARAKKTTARAAGKKTAAKVGATKIARKVAPKKTAARPSATKTTVKGGEKKTPTTVARGKTAKRVGGKKTVAAKNVPARKTRA